jgi:hypothetical protein
MQCVDFRGADKIIFRQAFDGVGGVSHCATVVGDRQIGVVVFMVSYPCHGIHERDGGIIIFEMECFAYDEIVLLPANQSLHQDINLCLGERGCASFTGLALFAGQIT